MKILHLNSFFYSGQAAHVFSLVQAQQKQGHLAQLAIEGSPSLKTLEVYDKTIAALGVIVTKPGDENMLADQITKSRYNLIHAHSPQTFATAEHLSKKFKIPYVVTCHGLGLGKEEFRPYLKEAGALFCTSQRVAAGLPEFAHKIHIIPNGVDLEEFKPAHKSDPVKIALVARIDPWKEKSYLQLCKAADLLEGAIFYTTNRNLKCPTKCIAWTDSIPDLLAKTDIVIGTGRAVIEGLAAGNAALILGRTYQGVLTPEKTEKQINVDLSGLSGSEPCYKAIFFDLATLTQNPIYLQRLQEFGRKLAEEHFDNKLLNQQIVNIYKKVLKRKQA